MDNLLDLVRTRRAEICDAFSKRIADCLPLERDSERFCGEMLDTILACREKNSRSPALAWAGKVVEEKSDLSLEQMFGVLKCLKRAVRLHLFRELTQKKSLLSALAALDDLVDLLCTSYVSVSLKSGRSETKSTQLPTGPAVVHRSGGDSDVLEKALAEAEARKKTILESSLDPIITIDHNGLVSEFNRAAEQVFGHSRGNVLGKPPSEVLFPPTKIAGYRNRIDRYLEAGEGSMLGKRTEVTAIRANGESFPAEVAMSISQQNGLPVLTFFVRDISLRKKAEEEQARYAAELKRSNKELERFAYVASHDLQEPLRKILTFGDRLEMKCGDSLEERGKECLDRMQNAAKRMQILINDLLSLSRVTTKGSVFEPVDLAQIAREVVSDLEVQIEQTGAKVEIGKMPTIKADAIQMRQLLQNLIVNALKFRKKEVSPVVQVNARFVKARTQRVGRRSNVDEKCRIIVQDNGIGFDEKHKERIFTIFQRLHTRDVYEGTGVGLAICRKIVERHEGTIVAHSKAGNGATFEVVLPVIPQ